MALDGGAQHFGVNLCGLDVLVPKHTSHILYRHIVSQCHCSEGVASYVESQLLPEVQLHLYHMKVVVGFLIAYFRQLVVVLLKTFIAGERIGVKNFVSVLIRLPSM